MADIKKSISNLVGNTPLLELGNYTRNRSLGVRLVAKLEYFNPGGSVKDRIAKSIVDDARERGLLRDDSVVVELTSGNTGIGLAAIARSRGYEVKVLGDNVSAEREQMLRAYGTEVTVFKAAELKTLEDAQNKVEGFAAQIPGAFIARQFDNPANPAVHFATTGPEIFPATDGEVDIFVATAGAGGTISGADS